MGETISPSPSLPELSEGVRRSASSFSRISPSAATSSHIVHFARAAMNGWHLTPGRHTPCGLGCCIAKNAGKRRNKHPNRTRAPPLTGRCSSHFVNRQNVADEDKHAEERTQGEGSEGEGSPSVVRSSSDKVTRKSEAERQAYFDNDPRAEEVRPYEVLCKNCKTWVKLGSKIRFALGNWNTHQQRCSGSLCVFFVWVPAINL